MSTWKSWSVFVTLRTNGVKQTNNAYMLRPYFDAAAQFYKK